MKRNKQHTYWREYWNKLSNVNKGNYQKNVGRTKEGSIVNEETWEKTLEHIGKTLQIQKKDDVLELCCGNGELIGAMAKNCRKAVGVDYSEPLIEQLNDAYGDRVNGICSDVFDVKFQEEEFDYILIYFALQHFDEYEVVKLIEKYIPVLRTNGAIYLGDVPDEMEKWNYINKKHYRIDYVNRILLQKPKIGYWYQKDFFKAIAEYFQLKFYVIQQPSYCINSAERFDVLLKK